MTKSESKPFTKQGILKAREKHLGKVPKDQLYRVFPKAVDLAFKSEDLTVAEAVAPFLVNWNERFYSPRTQLASHIHGGRLVLKKEHLDDIERVVKRNRKKLSEFRSRSLLESFKRTDRNTIKEVFEEFEGVLKKVGASKVLHLLAPRFFLMWDNQIARDGYGLSLRTAEEGNGEIYCEFLERVRDRCRRLPEDFKSRGDILRLIDIYHMENYTLGQKDSRR